MKEFVELWHTCPSCHQCYQNELAIDIATEFVSFVQGKYPRGDTESGRLRLFMGCKRGKPELLRINAILNWSVENRGITAVHTLLSIWIICIPHSRSYAFDEGTEDSARRAVTHFENQLEGTKKLVIMEGVAAAKIHIAIAKSKFESGNNCMNFVAEDYLTIRAGIDTPWICRMPTAGGSLMNVIDATDDNTLWTIAKG